uniref:Nucleotid_trans domain-containing protein n=1 Tax=Panagrellus redivivus TaxID=6233 RepID=A0A7E4VZI2_PANRE
MVGDPDSVKQHHQSNVTINFLKESGIKMHYISNSITTAPTLSQVSRLLATAMPFSEEYTDDDIFITADADMMPFHLKNHIPNILADQKAYFYNADCTGPIRVPPKRGNYKVPMYPMSTISATVATWREIMGLSSTNYGGHEIEEYLENEFGQEYFHLINVNTRGFRGSSVWYADQSLVSYKVAEWFKANPKNRAAATLTRGGCYPRIDRIRWPNPSEMLKQNLNQLGDAHLLANGYTDSQWKLFEPLVQLVFNGSKYDYLRSRLTKYRMDYVSSV